MLQKCSEPLNNSEKNPEPHSGRGANDAIKTSEFLFVIIAFSTAIYLLGLLL